MKQRLFQKCLAEGIGSYALVFFGCGSIMSQSLPGFIIPLVFGAVVACMIYTVGHISGAHFNPAVTVAFTITRHFPAAQVIPYAVAQVSGGFAAMAALSVLIPDASTYGATLPSVAPATAFLWEAMLSAFLMFVIISVATDTRAEGIMAGIAIGTIIALCAFIGGPYTGASMNPARSLAPALFEGNMDSLWIYLTAPFAGAAAGAWMYQLIRCTLPPSAAKGCC